MNEVYKDIPNELSPFDENLPISFLKNVFNFQLEQANRVAWKIYDEVVQNSNEINGLKFESTEEKSRLVVDVPDETLKGIRDGSIKLVKEKGQFFAQLRKDGKYGEKLPIKEEAYNDGPSSFDMSVTMQLAAIQESLYIISNQIQLIDQGVRDIINGQQNDRIGLYYSGAAMFIESLSVTDEKMKRELISQSLKSLTDAIFQLTLTMKTDIQYLNNKCYEEYKKMRIKLINEKMNSISQCYGFIHQSFLLKSAIYNYLGEIVSSAIVLEEYSKFIKQNITCNANLLAQCDIDDKGTDRDKWKLLAKLELDVSKVAKQLKNPEDVVYLEVKKEELK